MANSRLRGHGVADQGNANPFNAKTILWVIAAGLLAFGGFLFLSAYAPKWDRGSDGGTHVLSKSAVGFSGLKQLAELTKRKTDIGADKDSWTRDGFVLVTIGANTDPKVLEELVNTRRSIEESTTLYVLPKWNVMQLPGKRGFVQSAGMNDPAMFKAIMDKIAPVQLADGKRSGDGRIRGVEDQEMSGVDVAQSSYVRYLTKGITPVLEDSAGRTILGRFDDDDYPGYTYVLADPDLLSNKGLKTEAGAKAALEIVDALRFNDEDSVAFDTVLAGFEDSRNLLQLMFEPPFLAFTLALIVAALLVGLHALGRFGPPAIEGRAIPFGKRALADNIAMLIKRAGREDRLGDRYVAVVRDATGAALGAGHLAAEPLEKWLAGLPGGFDTLAYATRNAPDAASMQTAAAALFQWKKDVMRDHR
jgi:hypothetical protein